MTSSPDHWIKQSLNSCIHSTRLPSFDEPYRGKVRDVYSLDEKRLAIVVTDRISAFDHIMKEAIPFKGQILNRLAEFSFRKVEDLIPTHILSVPHPNVTVAKKCDPIPIEVVVRGYLTGHAWRTWQSGKRMLCGVPLPSDMKEHERFDQPILTPATKAVEGHDEDISEQEILKKRIVDPELWHRIREVAFQLFERGSSIAEREGLILVDTKYEFGLHQGELTLIDEVHTTDSSRYFYADGYHERLESNEPQKQLSKEFLREWLMDKNFQGKPGETLPSLPDSLRWSIYQRYAELFEILTGQSFDPQLPEDADREIDRVLTQL